MESTNVASIRRLYEHWGRGDFSAGAELFDPLVLFVVRPEFPEAGNYLGLESLRRYTRSLLEPWERYTIEAEQIEAAGDSVVAAVRQRGTGHGSGIAADLGYFHVWTFRGPRIIRFEIFRERAEAARAVGL